MKVWEKRKKLKSILEFVLIAMLNNYQLFDIPFFVKGPLFVIT